LTVVLDANVVVALVTKDERAPAIAQQMQAWGEAEEALHAPSLLPYEVANALTRKIVAGEVDPSDVDSLWQHIAEMPVTLHDFDHGSAVIGVARQLGRVSAYDAAYVVLAQELEADLWTLDGPLARNAASVGLPVRLIDGG
jgi:predicted nucleic acid-binding protein